MSDIAIPLATNYLTASVLTLVIPLVPLIIVALWYFLMWRSGTGER